MTDFTGSYYRDDLDDLDDQPAETYCTCYDPASMEYGPNYPCAHCAARQNGLR